MCCGAHPRVSKSVRHGVRASSSSRPALSDTQTSLNAVLAISGETFSYCGELGDAQARRWRCITGSGREIATA